MLVLQNHNGAPIPLMQHNCEPEMYEWVSPKTKSPKGLSQLRARALPGPKSFLSKNLQIRELIHQLV